MSILIVNGETATISQEKRLGSQQSSLLENGYIYSFSSEKLDVISFPGESRKSTKLRTNARCVCIDCHGLRTLFQVGARTLQTE